MKLTKDEYKQIGLAVLSLTIYFFADSIADSFVSLLEWFL